MIKYDEGNIEIEGNAKTVTIDWINITNKIVEILASEMGVSKEFVFDGMCETYQKAIASQEEGD